VNTLLTALHSMRYGFQSRWYGTYKQWQDIGGTVKHRPDGVEPGNWGCHVVFYKPIRKTETDPATGEEKDKTFHLLKSYVVFNADQVDGVEKYRVMDAPAVAGGDILPDFAPAAQLVASTKADVRTTGEQAFYRPPTPQGSWPNHTEGDYIQVPQVGKFPTMGAWYETVFHELGHWSEVRTDFNRQTHGYAFAELVAEMSACFLSAEMNIRQELAFGHAGRPRLHIQGQQPSLKDHRLPNVLWAAGARPGWPRGRGGVSGFLCTSHPMTFNDTYQQAITVPTGRQACSRTKSRPFQSGLKPSKSCCPPPPQPRQSDS
jgi:antirestriction protein ArdC